MSQNTNHLPRIPKAEEAVARVMTEGRHALYPKPGGIDGLADAIRDDLGIGGDLMLSNGGLNALSILHRALISPGDTVVSSDPSFLPLHRQISLAGGQVIEIPIYLNPFHLTANRVAEAITPKTKGILLIDPLNPLGTGYPADTKRAIVELAKDHGLWLVDDITYRDFHPEHLLAATVYPEGTITAYSFSKSFGMAGLRIGAILGPEELMARIRKHDPHVLGVNILAQVAALAALRSKLEWWPAVAETAERNQGRIKVMVDGLEGVSIPVFPSRSNTLILDIADTGVTPAALQERLLFKHKVFVRAGEYLSPRFGSRFVRISFTVAESGVERFCERFPKVLTELRAS